MNTDSHIRDLCMCFTSTLIVNRALYCETLMSTEARVSSHICSHNHKTCVLYIDTSQQTQDVESMLL